jgi:hypothetical protein
VNASVQIYFLKKFWKSIYMSYISPKDTNLGDFMSIWDKLREMMTDDKGLFQGGRHDRMFGRLKDEWTEDTFKTTGRGTIGETARFLAKAPGAIGEAGLSVADWASGGRLSDDKGIFQGGIQGKPLGRLRDAYNYPFDNLATGSTEVSDWWLDKNYNEYEGFGRGEHSYNPDIGAYESYEPEGTKSGFVDPQDPRAGRYYGGEYHPTWDNPEYSQYGEVGYDPTMQPSPGLLQLSNDY